MNWYLKKTSRILVFCLGTGIKNIVRAKSIHDDIEAYYAPNMDFEAVKLCMESTMAKIT